MYKILTTILFITTILTSAVFAQDTAPKHKPYVSAGTNWTPGLNASYSVEAGIWALQAIPLMVVLLMLCLQTANFNTGLVVNFILPHTQRKNYVIWFIWHQNIT